MFDIDRFAFLKDRFPNADWGPNININAMGLHHKNECLVLFEANSLYQDSLENHFTRFISLCDQLIQQQDLVGCLCGNCDSLVDIGFRLPVASILVGGNNGGELLGFFVDCSPYVVILIESVAKFQVLLDWIRTYYKRGETR